MCFGRGRVRDREWKSGKVKGGKIGREKGG
jgi:hypothetical protein